MLASSFDTPKLRRRGKRKWTSSENLSGEEVIIVTDNLQTPQNKRARGEDYRQEGQTPLGKVFKWVRETAKKTVGIFTSFREKYWRDDVDDQENETFPVYEHSNMQRHRHFETDVLCQSPEQDEKATSSQLSRKPLEENFSPYRNYEPNSSRHSIYDPSKYSTKTAAISPTDELWTPVSSSQKRERQISGSGGGVFMKKPESTEVKPSPPKPRNITAFKIKQHPTTVDNVVRLQEREQYMKLLAHYTSVHQPTNYGSIRRKPIVVEDDDNKEAKVSSTRLKAKRSVLSSDPLFGNTRLSSVKKDSHQPATVKVQTSPSKMPSGAVKTSKISSASGSKGFVELQMNNRQSRRSFDLLDDSWIKKWKQTLSTDNLEQERKIAKEKLKLEAIRKEKDDLELVSQEVKERMLGERESPVIEKEIDKFQELTDGMNDVIDKALGHGAPGELLVELPIGRITRGDIITLRPQTWLNDEVVNAYLHMIVERSKNRGPKVHAFNTFFYPKLMKTGHASLRRWTKKVDLFAMDIILIPIHLGMHWCLAVIDIKQKIFTYYDSLKGENPNCIQALRDYICTESLDKKKTPLDLTGWKNDSPKNIPEQLNGCDCGVFACKYAEYVSRRASFNFTQLHMPYFRRRMVYEILKKNLL
ncbi:sentrin-specific protease 1-like isoform X2 [Dendronephthya gigantea]|uniref:sentrin-specific protease 1-like isoform X2 n=1 Tax=Dendronephthya gigantea TaxID=151771 RepID=UPI00106CE41C|nr:sentrin-specific protease 1-like isoform X2 [Dendronephthya gigantea]